MKLGAWLWGAALVLVMIASGAGWLIHISPVLIAVPAALYALGAGAFCIGRPGLVTANRILSCVISSLLAIIAGTHLPLRVMFYISKNDLELTAADTACGKACRGRSAGCFRLHCCQISPDGNICLWTDFGRSEKIGFIKTASLKIVGASREIDLGSGWHYALLKSE
jgi:hypothetical protein